MELRHLRYFIAVAEERHFARAAARLNIAAPTLSHQIRSLEASLGAQLFMRKTRTAVALTAAGNRFLEEARATLKQADHAALVVRRAARGDVGNLAIGYIFSASCSGLLSSAIRQFRVRRPEVSFHLHQLEPSAIYAAMADGAIDVALTARADSYPAGLVGITVERSPLCLAIPTRHRLATRSLIALDSLENEEFVATSTEIGVWGKIGKTAAPHIVARAADVCSVLTLVSAGIGITIVSAVLARFCIPGVVFRKLTGTKLRAEIVLLHRRDEDGPIVKSFVEQMRMKAKDI